MAKPRYFRIGLSGEGLVRQTGVTYEYLEHGTGRWVPDNNLFGAIQFEASTEEITLEQAREVARRRSPPVDLLV